MIDAAGCGHLPPHHHTVQLVAASSPAQISIPAPELTTLGPPRWADQPEVVDFVRAHPDTKIYVLGCHDHAPMTCPPCG